MVRDLKLLDYLNVLICDAEDEAATCLARVLTELLPQSRISISQTTNDAVEYLDQENVDVIFVDLFSLGLDRASNFVLATRKKHPSIVFVLFVDVAESERRRNDFYRGSRRRFTHYYKLDKRTRSSELARETESVLELCRGWLAWSAYHDLLQANLAKPRGQAVNTSLAVAETFAALAGAASSQRAYDANTVFLSHRFSETEYVETLRRLLEQNGFKIVSGDSANTYISQAVLERIRRAEFFLSLMTKMDQTVNGVFVTSPWLLEEKGVAIAFRKPLVLMVEEGVTNFGGLQGDWQRIHFTAKGFHAAALKAVEQLKSYSGKGRSGRA